VVEVGKAGCGFSDDRQACADGFATSSIICLDGMKQPCVLLVKRNPE
jgi:hypothetical protein